MAWQKRSMLDSVFWSFKTSVVLCPDALQTCLPAGSRHRRYKTFQQEAGRGQQREVMKCREQLSWYVSIIYCNKLFAIEIAWCVPVRISSFLQRHRRWCSQQISALSYKIWCLNESESKYSPWQPQHRLQGQRSSIRHCALLVRHR